MLSVKTLFQTYKQKSDLRESSLELKGRAVTYFVEMFGDLAVDQITREHAEGYKLRLVTERRTRAAANFYLANIKPFFEWLLADSRIMRNPFAGVRRYPPERKVRPSFTPAEVQRVLRVADLRWQAIILLSARHSLRRGEILNICRSDIEGEYLHVQGKKRTATTWPWRIKNHAEALILISRPLAEVFVALSPELPAGQPYLLVEPKMYRRMIHLQAENSLKWGLRNCPYSNFDRSFKRLLKQASVLPKRFQDLRGCYAMTLRNGGMDLDEIQKLMRHSSLETTQKFYLRYEPAELAAESERILSAAYGS